jgi:hypothetical protein
MGLIRDNAIEESRIAGGIAEIQARQWPARAQGEMP